MREIDSPTCSDNMNKYNGTSIPTNNIWYIVACWQQPRKIDLRTETIYQENDFIFIKLHLIQ